MKKLMLGFMLLTMMLVLSGCSLFPLRDVTPIRDCILKATDDDPITYCNSEEQRAVLADYVKAFGLTVTSDGMVYGGFSYIRMNDVWVMHIQISLSEVSDEELTTKLASKYKSHFLKIIDDIVATSDELDYYISFNLQGKDNRFEIGFNYSDVFSTFLINIHINQETMNLEQIQNDIDRFLPLLHDDDVNKMNLVFQRDWRNVYSRIFVDLENNRYHIELTEEFETSIDALKSLIESRFEEIEFNDLND